MMPSKYTKLLNEVIHRVSVYIWASNVNNTMSDRLYVYITGYIYIYILICDIYGVLILVRHCSCVGNCNNHS